MNFVLKYDDYELYTKVYEKYGFDGISRLFILNKHIYEQDKTKNIHNLIYTDKDENSKIFLDNIILKLVSDSSPLLDYSMKEQSKIIRKIFSRNGQNLLVKNYQDKFNNETPNIVLDNTTIDLLNIDGNLHQNNEKGPFCL